MGGVTFKEVWNDASGDGSCGVVRVGHRWALGAAVAPTQDGESDFAYPCDALRRMRAGAVSVPAKPCRR